MILRSSFQELDGCRIHCVSGGEGPPVILVHGYGVSGAYMLPLAEALSRSFSVLIPDLPGSGKSDRPKETLGIGELAALLGQLVDARDISMPITVANSFGCQIVTALAVARPDALGPLVLVGPTVDPTRRSGRRQLFSALRALTREPESVVLESVRRTTAHDAFGLAATARVILTDRIEERLPSIRQPAVVVVGERDAFVDAAWGRRATDLLPHGRLVVVPDEPHAVHFTRPKLIADLVAALHVEEREDRRHEFGGSLEHRHVTAAEENEPRLRNESLPLLT